MANPFVTLPTAAAAAIPDLNLCPSDSAHFANGSKGLWSSGTIVTQGEAWSGNALRVSAVAGPTVWCVNLLDGYLAGGEDIAVSVDIKQITDPSATRYCRVWIREYDGSGTALGWIQSAELELTLDTPVRCSMAGTLQAATRKLYVYLYFTQGGGVSAPNGELYEVADVMIAEGTSTVFSPSLDCDTLYEVKDPSGLTATFTKGDDLTVGEAWSGDAVSYSRFDGADADGLLVAAFTAEQVLAAI